MKERTFLNRVTNSETDFLQEFLDTLHNLDVDYCVIGGLAVNAYTEPVVTLDLDVIVTVNKLDDLVKVLKEHYKVEKHEHSINISTPKSDLRIQIQTDPRYQEFIKRAKPRSILGYNNVMVASIEDTLQGKIWAYLDSTRRQSKRIKDLSDIARLIEAKPKLRSLLPPTIEERLRETQKE